MNVKSDASRNVIGDNMSKFKIGDKVHVKYIPAVYAEHDYNIMIESYPEFDEIRTIKTLTYEGYYLDEPTGFWFSEDSLEMVWASRTATTTPTQRTLLGLETEYNLVYGQMLAIHSKLDELEEKIEKLKELEE